MHTTKQSVLLVAMPFAGVTIPSIQLPVLEGYGREHGVDIQTRHLYLKAAETYGLANYHSLIYPPSDSYTAQMVFSRYLFPEHWQKNIEKIKEYYATFVSSSSFPFEEYLRRTDVFYHWVLEHLDWQSFDLIGFTLNYGQLLPSLAIAKHIKQQAPEKKIVLGGSRVAGEMGRGVLRAFDFIDYVVSGDGEDALVLLASDLGNFSSIPGLIYRDSGEVRWNTTESVIDLAASPIPSYDPFFDELHSCSDELQQFFQYYGRLPVEISRGCWWNRCTFCNLNIQHPCYREKPIDHIAHEIQLLSDRYHILDFQLIGNTLPRTQYRGLFEALKLLGRDFSFFVEARAGQLTSDDYRLMKEAGFTTIQTGIESFSTHYLRTMNKGVRVIDNIAALKFCAQYGIYNSYNLIVRYPNEEPVDYEETKKIVQQLQGYLDSPQLCPLRIMHGSPIQQLPEKYNISALQTTPLDLLMYPPDVLEKNFTFVYTFSTTKPVPAHDWETLVQDWTKTRESTEAEAVKTHALIGHLVFYSVDGGTFMKIYDKRDKQHIRILKLNAVERDVLLACHDVISYQELQQRLSTVPEFTLAAILQSFEHAGLVYHEDDSYLSLPLQYRSTIPQNAQFVESATSQILVNS